MAEPVDGTAIIRELLHEFRSVGNALGAVVERTTRVETKVDRLIADQATTAGMQRRIDELEHWTRTEMEHRNVRGKLRGVLVGALATVLGGAGGALIAHFWK